MEEEKRMRQKIRATTEIRPPLKKVQVVYYLMNRNGQLEHPHYMEVSLLHHHHQLRLRDVIHRLTALRGKGMPSMYSWSCKRGYKNGYVWNDLSENDIIYPADGAEYVLKGSEIIENCPNQEHRFQPIQVYSRPRHVTQAPQNHNLKRSTEAHSMLNNNEMADYAAIARYGESDCGGQEEYDEEEKTSYTSSTTPQSRCSRGIATDELNDTEPKPEPKPISEPTVPDTKPKPSHSRTTSENLVVPRTSYVGLGRNSVFLQLISCGGTIANRESDEALQQNCEVMGPTGAARRQKHGDEVTRVSDEKVMIEYMSENPRFGNLQSEEKAYFSGSIVEAVEQPQVAVLKRCNSYNEERMRGLDANKEELVGVDEIMEGDEKKKKKVEINEAVAKRKAKCIPLMIDGFLKKC